MQLTELHLSHFRTYPKRTFKFNKNTTVFVGPNAIGKTNILEAIFFLATGKSFRAERDDETIEKEEDVAKIKCKISNFQYPISNEKEIDNQQSDTTELEITLTHGVFGGEKVPVKRYTVNGVSRRMVDFVGNLRVVLFEPEDVELVRGSPSKKRKYLDFLLIQVDREYRRNLATYEKGVRQRNKVLERIRDEGASEQQLFFWDQLLIKNGQYLTRTREQFIEFVNLFDKPFAQFQIRYDHSFISEARLAQYHDAEIASANTLVGPHRDNFEVYDGERSLSSFGSRGEQRLAVLWLKLAELTFVEQKTQERPLLLLDDIFSELDHGHREEVISVMDQQQTIMTTTDIHFVPEDIVKEVEMVKLK